MFFYEETKQDNMKQIEKVGLDNLKKGSLFFLDGYEQPNDKPLIFQKIRHIQFYGVTLTYVLASNILIPLDKFTTDNFYYDHRCETK